LKIPLNNAGESWFTALNRHGEILLEGLSPNNDVYIDQVVEYVKKNYMRDIGINTIAAILNITPNYLSSLFHKKTGRKFIGYLTELRILKAKELLAEDKLSMEKIAAMVGYHSPRHFHKLFWKYTAQYPSEYRKRFQKIRS
jgi:two-component system response regulator YesN